MEKWGTRSPVMKIFWNDMDTMNVLMATENLNLKWFILWSEKRGRIPGSILTNFHWSCLRFFNKQGGQLRVGILFVLLLSACRRLAQRPFWKQEGGHGSSQGQVICRLAYLCLPLSSYWFLLSPNKSRSKWQHSLVPLTTRREGQIFILTGIYLPRPGQETLSNSWNSEACGVSKPSLVFCLFPMIYTAAVRDSHSSLGVFPGDWL